MGNSIIQVNNLSKSYIISHEGRQKYTALRDVMVQKAKKIFSFPKTLTSLSSATKEKFWALKDINFEINQGDRVGIIGRNGAGKSTLLKILSRITEPTTGEIRIKGRVASMLEVGTGFHPELTGRENIYLNGTILGMSRSEIKRKFDEIVDFAEVEKFLDTPVKRYSSGMYVRLAFAVAAHLEPEILVVDEVLAVGDAQFQKKCLGKMEDVSKNGRTVLFVSHQMGSISQLCNSAILLDKGSISKHGNTSEVIKFYLSDQNQQKGYVNQSNNKINFLKCLDIQNVDNDSVVIFPYDECVVLNIELEINECTKGLCLAFGIQDDFNRRVCLDFYEIDKKYIKLNNSLKIKITLPKLFFTPGTYLIDITILIPNVQVYDILYKICSFEIIENNSKLVIFPGVDAGCVMINTNCEFI